MYGLVILFIIVVGFDQLTGLDNRKLLQVRAVAAIPEVHSDIYEIYQMPYGFEVAQHAAIAVMVGDNNIDGEVVFVQKLPPTGPIFIRGNITGLQPGKHGIHIHQAGDLREGCSTKLGGHFNPHRLEHGGPRSQQRHLGDLGNIEAKLDGTAEIVTIDPYMTLAGGPRGVVGRALVVTESEDDLGPR